MKTLGPLYISAVILSATLFASAGLWADSQVFTLYPGQQKTIHPEDITNLSIGNPKIATAKYLKNLKQIILTALAPGKTSLILWKKNGEQDIFSIHVQEDLESMELHKVSALVTPMKGIKIFPAGSRIILKGQALSLNDLKMLENLSKHYPNIINLVTLSPKVAPVIVAEINKQLKFLSFPNVHAKHIGSEIFLNGTTPSEQEKQKIIAIVKSIFPYIQPTLSVDNAQDPLIEINVKLVEINRSKLQAYGVRWPGVLQADFPIDVNNMGSSYSMKIDSQVSLHFLEDKGWARILSQPRLICRSGEEASFHAGGEIPIRLISERTAEITFKKYGILLKIKPLVLGNGMIHLDINIEVSTLDGSNTIEGIPSFLTRRLHSVLSLESKQVMVVGGLTDYNDLKGVTKIPGMGSIPIFGELFKSRNFRNGVTELMIAIQPTILSTTLLVENQKSHDKFIQRYNEAEQWFHPKMSD